MKIILNTALIAFLLSFSQTSLAGTFVDSASVVSVSGVVVNASVVFSNAKVVLLVVVDDIDVVSFVVCNADDIVASVFVVGGIVVNASVVSFTGIVVDILLVVSVEIVVSSFVVGDVFDTVVLASVVSFGLAGKELYDLKKQTDVSQKRDSIGNYQGSTLRELSTRK